LVFELIGIVWLGFGARQGLAGASRFFRASFAAVDSAFFFKSSPTVITPSLSCDFALSAGLFLFGDGGLPIPLI